MQPDRKHGSASQKVDADHEAFFQALQGGDINFVTVFLCKHPDAAHWNTPDGTPPLVLAVGSQERDRWIPQNGSYRHDMVMEMLISYGADVNAKTDQDPPLSAVDLARAEGHDGVARAIEVSGGRSALTK